MDINARAMAEPDQGRPAAGGARQPGWVRP
jgi:hypothetical protein